MLIKGNIFAIKISPSVFTSQNRKIYHWVTLKLQWYDKDKLTDENKTTFPVVQSGTLTFHWKGCSLLQSDPVHSP